MRLRLAVVGSVLLSHVACIKEGMDQLASPASVNDMQTILHQMDLPGEVGAVVQEVLDVGRTNLADGSWDALLQKTSASVVDAAAPRVRTVVGEITPALRAHQIDAVQGALSELAAEPGPHDRDLVVTRLATTVVDALGTLVPPERHDELVLALTVDLDATPSDDLDAVIAGPAPFTRLLARNVALGFVDGLATMDPAPLHRFVAEERSAFAAEAQSTLRWWKTSFWVVAVAAGVGTIGLSVQLWRDVHLRRRNNKTLRLLVGALKARETDPTVREILTTLADPKDPDAARHLREFYEQHPDLRLDLRTDPNRHPVAHEEPR